MPVTHSPLRYPGGKTQLSNFVKSTLEKNHIKNIVYCEPFSGGFGLGLELLYSGKASSVIINDYDIAIYSVWYAILNDTQKFIELIQNTPITIEEWHKQKNIYNKYKTNTSYCLKLAYATFFLNRTNHSGIITGGPIGGYLQESKNKLNCRFNKKGLIQKVIQISSYKERIEIYNLEAKDLIKKVVSNYEPNEVFVYLDPPYYQQGKNLYKNFFKHQDHIDLYNVVSEMEKYYWIVTYDYNNEIKKIYHQMPSKIYTIKYSAHKVRKEKEYLFYNSILNIEEDEKVQFF